MKLSNLSQLGSKRKEALSESGINSVLDLLNLFPHRYLDRTSITDIRDLSGQGEQATVVGTIKNIKHKGYGKKKRLEVIIQDDTASLKGTWFRGEYYVKNKLSKDERVAFFGEIKQYGQHLSIAHPEYNKISDSADIEELKKIVPVYPGNKRFSEKGINSKLIHKWQKAILKTEKPPEFLPDAVRKEYDLPNRHKAYRMIHFPQTTKEYKQALKRFKFEEFFLFELSVGKTKNEVINKDSGPLLSDMDNYTSRFFNNYLSFDLTDDQRSALADIKKDVRSGKQMNRLLQGDVGSGKTVVALGAILMALDNDYQAAFMAPTEILAEQHFRTLTNFLDPLDINIRLLVGNQNKSVRTDILTDLEGGGCDIVVGTHAVIQQQVQFNKLGLAVIDEQHRFGVKQRAEILNKGTHPHVLVMSATPIPRSLAMTLYSDLDISVIKEMPGGRKPVKTAVRPQKKHDDIYDFVEQELQDGGQAYIVYPLVEKSEKVDLKDATAGFKKLQKRFKDFEVGLLHGQMKSEEKEAVMQQFISNEIQVLVSTTVIEVGVDVPNASIMIVEHAERFGLSQLHQLRGRIGRGQRQSYCILIYGQQLSKDGQFRLKKMAATSDGFEIAEADLKLRGPGNFLGTEQSGLPEFRVADIIEDQWLLEQAKNEAWKLIDEDPKLSKEEHQKLKEVFKPYYKERSKLYGVG